MMTFILHPNNHLAPCEDIRDATLPALTFGATRAGRLRATLPTTPVPLEANRHTVRAHDSADKDTQRVMITKPSSDIQSESIRKSAEPIRSTWAVQWSSLSHKKPKADREGPSVSPAHSRSLWTWDRAGGRGITARNEEHAMRKKPTDGARWSWGGERERESERDKDYNIYIYIWCIF